MQDSNINPNIDYTSLEMVNRLLADQALYNAQVIYNNKVADFLNRLESWKLNNEQRVANKLDLEPVPTPPPGYTLPPAPKLPPAPVPSFEPQVGDLSQFGQYPAPGDNNPAGTVINYHGQQLIKVIHATPFGNSQWWEAKK